MTKQEFLAMSLPYGLKVLRPEGKTVLEVAGLLGTLVQFKEKEITYASLCGCKPLCRPLSDYVLFDEIGIIYEVAIQNLIKGNLSLEQTDFWLVSWLIKHHFDLAGFIEKGEAIDINTLNENPYE